MLTENFPVPAEDKVVTFKRLEVESAMQPTVIVHLANATVEIQVGTDRQTVEAALLALKTVC